MTSRSSTPERDALRDMVDGFTRKEIVPHLADWERAGEIPRALPRHRIAEMSRQVHAAGAYARDVVDRWMNGQDVNAEVAMPKNMAVAACNHAVDEAVQIHGGMGFMRESEVERHYRDSRVLGIGGGTSEMMNEIIAKAVLD